MYSETELLTQFALLHAAAEAADFSYGSQTPRSIGTLFDLKRAQQPGPLPSLLIILDRIVGRKNLSHALRARLWCVLLGYKPGMLTSTRDLHPRAAYLIINLAYKGELTWDWDYETGGINFKAKPAPAFNGLGQALIEYAYTLACQQLLAEN